MAATPVQALQEGTRIARMMAIIPLHQRSQPSHSPRYRNHRTAVEEEVAAVPVVVVVPPPVVVAVVVAEAAAPVAADTSLHRPPTARASTPATANPHFQPHQSQKPTTVKITRIQDPPTVVPIQVRILVLMRNMNGKVVCNILNIFVNRNLVIFTDLFLGFTDCGVGNIHVETPLHHSTKNKANIYNPDTRCWEFVQ